MFRRKNSPNSIDSAKLNTPHPFIKKSKVMMQKVVPKAMLESLLNELKEKNFVFSNN